MSTQIPQFFIDTEDPNNTHFISEMELILLSELILGILILLLIVLFFKNKPNTPPSVSQTFAKLKYRESFRKLLKNRNFLIAFLAMGIFMGINISLQTIAQQYTKMYHISSYDASLIVSVGTSFSFIPAIFISYLSTKFDIYNPLIIIFQFLGTLGVILTATIPSEPDATNFGIALMVFLSLGQGVNPVVFELFAEITYPVMEEIVGSLYVMMGVAVTNILIYPINNAISDQNKQFSFLLLFGPNILSLVLALFVKDDLRRQKVESDKKTYQKLV